MTDELDALEEELTGESPPVAPAAEEPPVHQPAKAVPARKPGWWGRLGDRATGWVGRIELPQWNLRNFLYGLLLLIVLILFFRNWTAVRLDLVLWRFDVPKSLVILGALLLGALIMRAWDVHQNRRAAEAEVAEQQ